MKTKPNTCENYPLLVPFVSVSLSLFIYTIGAYILSGFGIILVLPYILFCLWVEYRVLGKSCRYCYYFGKLCGPGKGKIAPLFFKAGDPKIFAERNIGWRDLVPDMLVFLIPFLSGIFYLFFNFHYSTLALLAVIAFLALPGTGYIRNNLLCRNCRQRGLGCRAQKLFGK